MSSVDQLDNFLRRATTDTSLTTTHLSVCMALCAAWLKNGFKNPFNISRKRLMSEAKIKSKTTYHKVIGDLAARRYLQYNPSYHPANGSQIILLHQGDS